MGQCSLSTQLVILYVLKELLLHFELLSIIIIDYLWIYTYTHIYYKINSLFYFQPLTSFEVDLGTRPHPMDMILILSDLQNPNYISIG